MAILLNIDRILLGHYSLVRTGDTLDGPIPWTRVFLNNILNYGIVSQSPENMCGISNHSFGQPPALLPIMFLLPLYLSYLFISLAIIFIGFLGMFLLLHDDFKCSQKASLIGALFFSFITSITPALVLTVPGIPLFIWCFERIFDNTYVFAKRLMMYSYILIYFIASSFVLIAPSILLFYIIFFIFFSKVKKSRKNIFTIVLIWGLFVLLNLPSFAELFSNLPTSQRNNLQFNMGISWLSAAKNVIADIYSNTPSLLGLLIILIYILSSSKSDRNKYFYFPVISIVLIYLLGFLFVSKQFMGTLSSFFSILRSARLERIEYLLDVFISILIGQSCNYLIKKGYFSNRKAWYLSLCAVILYIGLGLKYKLFDISDACIIKILSPLMLIIQFLSLAIFMAGIWLTRGNKNSVFAVLFVSFALFLIAITGHARIFFGPENIQHFYGSPQIETIKAIEKGNLGNFRVVDLNGSHQSKLLINGFKCADGFANVYPQTYKEFWEKVIEPEIKGSERYRKELLGTCSFVHLFYSGPKNEPIKELSFNPDLLRLINVKYVFTDESILDCEKYGFIEIAAKSSAYVKNEAFNSYFKWGKYFSKREFYVYKNKYYAAPVFLTGNLDTFDNKEQLLDQLGKNDYNYLIKHTFAFKDNVKSILSTNFNTTDSTIERYELTPDEIRVWLNNKYPVILNWTTNYNHNWSCEIDGKNTPIFRIYNSFMGVIVPPGHHVVILSYRNIYLDYAYLILVIGFIAINIHAIRYLKTVK